ncbi:hypothetical protein VTI28DRAFT_1487 [Corynascus sepedonium]
MTRQYYCWRIALTFSCGCVETPSTTHACGPERAGCSGWLLKKHIDRPCDAHRVWGLTDTDTKTANTVNSLTFSSSSSFSSPSPSSHLLETSSQGWIGLGATVETAARRRQDMPRSESGSVSSLRNPERRDGGFIQAEGGNWEGDYSPRRRA